MVPDRSPSGNNVDGNVCRDEASAGQRVTEVSFEGCAHLGSLDVIDPAQGGLDGQGIEEGTKVDGGCHPSSLLAVRSVCFLQPLF